MQDRPVYIFEDDDYGNFFPLTVNRAVYQLRLGIDLIYEKWKNVLPSTDVRFSLRDHLAAITEQNTEISCNDLLSLGETGALFVNGRYIPDEKLVELLRGIDDSALVICNGNLVAAAVAPGSDHARNLELMKYWGYGHFKAIVKGIPKVETEAREVKHIWDFVKLNPEQIALDFERISQKTQNEKISPESTVDDGCLIHSKSAVVVGARATVDGQVVIDARGGPVMIDCDAKIEPHSRIEGPCYIGKGSMIVGGKIREGCSIGPVCKVGGELEETVILGYSNKFHDGFLGHSYLGEWVNLGAMTTNSDLKNNYGNVRVNRGGGEIDSGMMKVGSFIGDHVKTGIGTMLNTGITIGFASNVFGAGLVVDKFVPPFSWGTTGNYVEYDKEKAIDTARKVTERRGVAFTGLDEELFKTIFGETAAQRKTKR